MGQGYGRDLKRILREHGCEFVRQGKGDHEVWYSPITTARFTLDAGVVKRSTALGTLKQAGIKARL